MDQPQNHNRPSLPEGPQLSIEDQVSEGRQAIEGINGVNLTSFPSVMLDLLKRSPQSIVFHNSGYWVDSPDLSPQAYRSYREKLLETTMTQVSAHSDTAYAPGSLEAENLLFPAFAEARLREMGKEDSRILQEGEVRAQLNEYRARQNMPPYDGYIPKLSIITGSNVEFADVDDPNNIEWVGMVYQKFVEFGSSAEIAAFFEEVLQAEADLYSGNPFYTLLVPIGSSDAVKEFAQKHDMFMHVEELNQTSAYIKALASHSYNYAEMEILPNTLLPTDQPIRLPSVRSLARAVVDHLGKELEERQASGMPISIEQRVGEALIQEIDSPEALNALLNNLASDSTLKSLESRLADNMRAFRAKAGMQYGDPLEYQQGGLLAYHFLARVAAQAGITLPEITPRAAKGAKDLTRERLNDLPKQILTEPLDNNLILFLERAKMILGWKLDILSRMGAMDVVRVINEARRLQLEAPKRKK